MAYDSHITPSTSGRDSFINPSPVPVPGHGPVPTTTNYTYNQNYGVRGSEDGGDDSVGGRKVKFLCSFGGKILPRPSDGVLRYVGGQTRIISVRRDVSFGELVSKMVDVCGGQTVVMKYQLPFEELDALVSVSCPDDLDNMMEEYQTLLETSPDGSVKLRIFLFNGSEGDTSGLLQFGGVEGSGHRYVDAVNGFGDGFSGGGGVGGVGVAVGITRKESMASGVSTQNSDMSGAEALDGAGAVGQDNSVPSSNFTVFSPRAESATPSDNGLRLETSVTPLVVPTPLVPPLSPPTQPVTETERTVPVQLHGQQQLQGYDLQNTGLNFPPPPSAFLGGYTDPHRDVFGGADYQQPLSTQIVYGNHQVVGAPRPVHIQPQYRDNGPVMTQQFIPAVQMTVSPASSPMSMNPGIVQPIVQSIVQPQRVVAMPPDQSYVNTYHSQVTGGYGWQQVTAPDHVPYSEGWMPHQHTASRLADCAMCQKALPHAHSDTVVQDQKTVSDTNPIYQSLQLDDISRAHVVAPSPNQGVVGVASNMQVPYGAAIGKVPSPRSDDALHHPLAASSQIIQEPLGGKPVNGDSSPVGNVTYQIPQQYNPETSMDYPGRVIRNPDGRPMELISHTKPSDILHGNEHNMPPAQQYMKDDIFEQVIPQTLPNATFTVTVPSSTPQTSQHFHTGHLDAFDVVQGTPPMVDMLSSSNDPRDDVTGFYAEAGVDNATSIANVNTPNDWVAVGNDSSAHSLFSNQNPWNMMAEAHYPPPKPKFTMRRESSAKELHGLEINLNSETQPSDGIKPTLEPVQTTTGAAVEDLIKQQLQATAEGVAASILNSTVTSNVDYLSQEANISVSEVSHEMSGQTSDANIQTKMEALKIKPEKANLGFPMSDGKGRLQIIKNSDLEELQELGSGTFGTVYHGKWRGTDVAIKRINDRCFAGKTSEQERMRDDFWSEAIILADLHHPNVVAFYGVVLDGPGGSVATVTEYMTNGSLRTALQKNERNLDKRKRLLITMDVAFGMEYLHSKNIVHFDLKSDNLLVNLRDPHRPICKVGDLGLSKVKCKTLISGGVRGTLPWMAPELLNGSSSLVSEKVDVFSFGIVMWELLTGEEPYADLHYGAIIGGIVSNTLRPAVPENCDPSWRALMERCWSAEPSKRPNFTDIANELRSMASKLPSKPQTPTAAATKTNV